MDILAHFFSVFTARISSVWSYIFRFEGFMHSAILLLLSFRFVSSYWWCRKHEHTWFLYSRIDRLYCTLYYSTIWACRLTVSMCPLTQFFYRTLTLSVIQKIGISSTDRESHRTCWKKATSSVSFHWYYATKCTMLLFFLFHASLLDRTPSRFYIFCFFAIAYAFVQHCYYI